MHLTQVPDLSRAPNIERVNLEFCVRLIEVPSYFQHLKQLKELSLVGCSSLCNLSPLPKNLIKLKVHTGPLELEKSFCSLCGCQGSQRWFPSLDLSSKLERFPKVSENMEFVKILKLECLAIEELPVSMFENLPGLERLSLHYCVNLAFLPDSIRSLSSLRKLNISFCEKLESLPLLPSSISVLDVTCCTSLKMVSSSIPLVKQNWDALYHRGYKKEVFNFLGCELLDENARKVLMDEVLFRILRFATLFSKYGSNCGVDDETLWLVYNRIVWPGSEIPRWFIHKSEGSSICINLPYPTNQWHNGSHLGLASCVVVEFKDLLTARPSCFKLHWDSVFMFPNGDSRKHRQDVDHGFLYFLGRLRGFDACCNSTLSKDSWTDVLDSMNSEYVFVFTDKPYGQILTPNDELSDQNVNELTRTTTACFSFNLDEESKKFAKIKRCGVHLLYTQEAKRFGYLRRVASESSEGEAVYSKSDQEEDEVPLLKRFRT
ncbi:hypothetical protein TIFTF001_039109 [Ficus carica]|uniref:C-JID domain-containing protein n=1 Tax=Ficus carica TaxID=3494 RepID=A0AA88E979_FICCA|nr:hypothetical protein TIFTF001_039107 [Ficus carica]GMN70065.1 hypothetical protein TIFTF001_039109 [Ficus carica]